MIQLSPILREIASNQLAFMCPGCKQSHSINYGGSNTWQWNGNADKPTITPSVLVRSGHYVPSHKLGESCWCTFNAEHADDSRYADRFHCGQCHSFVTDGNIQFLHDCSHALAGQTVPLPEFKD